MRVNPSRRTVGASAQIVLSLLALAAVVSGAEPPDRPRIPVNLMTNSDFETDDDRDGVPDGWFHSEPQYWVGPTQDSPLWKELHALWVARGAAPDRVPFQPPGTLEGGTYRWEAAGYKSGHSISVDEVAEKKWGEWDTVVGGIKANADYVVLGWRRQSGPDRRAAGTSPWMKLAVFGKMIPIPGTIDDTAWVPFAVPVHSGPFHGKCGLGLIVEKTPAKVWLDRIELFEGTLADLARFRLGHKGAILEYPIHATAYASPDVACPLFFDLLWSFHTGNGGPDLEIVVDLPEGIDLTGGACGLGLKLGPPKSAKPVVVVGRPYIRRTIPVLSADRQKEFNSGGRRAARLWIEIPLDAKLAGDEFQAFYRAQWAGGAQAWQPLRIQIIRVPAVAKWPRDLLVGIGGASTELVASRAGKLAGDPAGKNGLPAAGVNCLVLDGGLDPKIAELIEKAGISLAAWFRLDGPNLPAAALSADAAGKPVPGRLCPSYRAENMVETVFAGPAELVRNGTTILLTDLRDAQACFCPRCVNTFQEVVKREHPKITFVPPAEFVAKPAEFKELNAAWNAFCAERLADLYHTLREELARFRQTAKPPVRNATVPLRLLALVPPPGSGAQVDHARMGAVLDFVMIEPDMLLAEAGGTPAWVGDEAAKLVEQLGPGGRAGVVITAGSTADLRAAAPVIRHSDVRDQVLEALVAGAKAVVLRPFYAVDGMDLKQFSEALGLLAPFGDLLADGEASSAVRAADKTISVRCFGKPDQMLVLVGDYRARPAAETQLLLEFPKDRIHSPTVLVDVASGAVIAKDIPAGTTTITVPQVRRARLFALGAPGKLPPRQE